MTIVRSVAQTALAEISSESKVQRTVKDLQLSFRAQNVVSRGRKRTVLQNAGSSVVLMNPETSGISYSRRILLVVPRYNNLGFDEERALMKDAAPR